MILRSCPDCSPPSRSGGWRPGRRDLFRGAGAVLAATAVGPARAQPAPRRIDVHHHILPPDYVRIAKPERIGAPAPNGAMPAWTPELSIAAMDRNGIAKAYTSVSSPGIWFGDPGETRELARLCNDYAAGLRTAHPDRFGVFASLPLPDVPATLVEIARALDTLGVDGVGLMTNYDGRSLGDPLFEPVLQELDRRKAVAYVHPTSVNCNRCIGDLAIPASTIEFPFDTTRTITSLIYSGALARFPNIRFVFSHAGGALPVLAERIARISVSMERFRNVVPGGPLAAMRRLHYDTALSANATAMEGLKRLAGVDRILFGTDYPFAPEASMAATVAGLDGLGWTAGEMRQVEHDNAAALFAAGR